MWSTCIYAQAPTQSVESMHQAHTSQFLVSWALYIDGTSGKKVRNRHGIDLPSEANTCRTNTMPSFSICAIVIGCLRDQLKIRMQFARRAIKSCPRDKALRTFWWFLLLVARKTLVGAYEGDCRSGVSWIPLHAAPFNPCVRWSAYADRNLWQGVDDCWALVI